LLHHHVEQIAAISGANRAGGGVQEQFPGVIYRVKEPRAVILLFSSGKIVCSGAKSEHDAWEAVRKLLRELEKYGLIEEEEEW